MYDKIVFQATTFVVICDVAVVTGMKSWANYLTFVSLLFPILKLLMVIIAFLQRNELIM